MDDAHGCERLLTPDFWPHGSSLVLGDAKGVLLREILASRLQDGEKRVVVEIGAYCGYSAVLLASMLRADDVIVSIEIDPSCVEWTRAITHLAQITNHRILHGNVESSLPDLRELLRRLNKQSNTDV